MTSAIVAFLFIAYRVIHVAKRSGPDAVFVSAAITPAITPSGSDAKMSDLDEEVSAVSISPPPSPTLARGKRVAPGAPGFPPGFDARAVRLVG